MKDCCGQEIVPNRKKLSIHTNVHPNTDGSSWGWIEGCTLNICWSNDNAFNYEKASEFVKQWNEKAEREGVNAMEHPVEPDSLRSRVNRALA